ncbi:thiaminase II [Breoghania sp.]|uniref:thiaminase II n=1 Tax=Breoghania sp. TaxID=2065378 RepID=UPI0026237CB7|nr:thiaminase II [Breoghania sp.]MDJ0932904.1 thiaminase II [Breoghania sp.]
MTAASKGLFERLKAAAADEWAAYIDHDFVRGLGNGTLPEECFRHYLAQDYVFLIHFARAYALAVYKSRTLDDMRSAGRTMFALLDMEMDLHVRLCARWGLSAEDLEATPEASATMAYTRYVLEEGMRGDLLDLHVALVPCVIGYWEIGKVLAAQPGALDTSNPYHEWIAEYSSDEYQQVAAEAEERLDRLAGDAISAERFTDLVRIFSQAMRLEIGFWKMGLDLEN